MIKKFSEYTHNGLSSIQEDNKWVSTRTDKYDSEEDSKNINDMEPEEFYQYIKNHYEGIPSKYFKNHKTNIKYFDNERETKFIILQCCEIKDNNMVRSLTLSIIYHNLDVYIAVDKYFMDEKSFRKLIDSFKLVVGDKKDFAYGDFIVYPKKHMEINTENEFALTVLNTIIENCNKPLIKKINEHTNEKINENFNDFIDSSEYFGKEINFVAEDVTKKVSLDVKFFEIEFDKDAIANMPPYDIEYAACIYVMPNDSVEIRSMEPGKVLHGVIDGITGKDVREKDLHRDEWHFHSVE